MDRDSTEYRFDLASVPTTIIETNEKDGKQLKIQDGLVEFKDVCFAYTAERQILKSLSLKFAPGQITAVVGGSGAGKTTTVDLLLKLYEAQTGQILIDGQQLNELNASSVRACIGMVAADGAIFRGTLASNLRYRKPDATDEELTAAIEQAGLGNLVARLPQGVNTPIGQSGMGLSVGERQRLQIGRVLLSRPKILVLDEATANLDYNTEAEIKQAIQSLRGRCTIIIIAHRYSMVRDADQVYVLSDGEVIESGTPDALINSGGWFADFASSVAEDNQTIEADDGTEETEVDAEADDESLDD